MKHIGEKQFRGCTLLKIYTCQKQKKMFLQLSFAGCLYRGWFHFPFL